MRLRWFWFPRITVPLTYHLLTEHHVVWRSIFGVQIGGVFFGVVRSDTDLIAESAETGATK